MAKGNFLKEFKDFAMRGNVVDMAVGVIIGGAFGKIVSSLVSDIIMPPIGWLIGGVSFTELSVKIPAILPWHDAAAEPVMWNYVNFIQVVIDFIIVAFCIFMIIKGINKLSNLKKKEEETPATPPAPSKEEVLLTEIRDLLKEQKNK